MCIKITPVETIQEMWERGIKGNGGNGEFQYEFNKL
jgi:hypothetical protein